MGQKNTTLRAYEISEKRGDGSVIVFAYTAQEAKSYPHDIWDHCDEWTDRRAKRAPAFDDATRPTPVVSEYLARGWAWPCHNCEDRVFGDTTGRIVDDAKSRAWCNERCKEMEP